MKIAGNVQGLDAIKLAAYQHIQDHRQKLMNRLSYVLLQHIVRHYQTNEYLQLALAGSHPTAQRYIADAIELYMQQIIEGKPSTDCGQADYLKNEQKGERAKEKKIKQLEEEAMSLRESNKDLKKELVREVKKTQRALQKYNILSELTLDISHRHKSDLALLQNKYQLKIQQLQANNSELREKVIKLDTLLELCSNGTTPNTKISVKKEQNIQQKRRRLVYQHFLLFSRSAEDNPSLNTPRKLSIQSNIITQSHNLVKPHLKTQTKVRIKLDPIAKCNMQTQTQRNIQPQRMLKDQSIQAQSSSSLIEIQTQYEKDGEQQESYSFGLLQQVQAKNCQLQAQIKILKSLNCSYEKQSRKARWQASAFKSEKVQLIHLCNRLQDETNRLNNYISQLELEIQKQNDFIVTFDQQKQLLINQFQSKSFNFQTQNKNQLHILKQESYSQGRLTQTEESSSTTPKNNESQSCQPETLPTMADQSPIPFHPQSAIPKEVISRYLLEMLDQKCRGEAKLILIDQIGECLGWSTEDYKRVQFYKRRVRLRDEAPSSKEADKQNLEDRFYRFLRSECGQE